MEASHGDMIALGEKLVSSGREQAHHAHSHTRARAHARAHAPTAKCIIIAQKRLKLRLSGSARKSQKQFRDTPMFKFRAVLTHCQPFLSGSVRKGATNPGSNAEKRSIIMQFAVPTERRLLTVVVVAVVVVVRLCSSSSLLFASACGAGHDTDGAADAARLRALPAEQRHPAAWPQGERTSEPASSPLPSGLPLSFFFSSWAAHRATTAFRYRFIIIIRMAYGHFIAIWVSLLSTLVCKRVLRSLNAAAICCCRFATRTSTL
jgi:hypothetical protein